MVRRGKICPREVCTRSARHLPLKPPNTYIFSQSICASLYQKAENHAIVHVHRAREPTQNQITHSIPQKSWLSSSSFDVEVLLLSPRNFNVIVYLEPHNRNGTLNRRLALDAANWSPALGDCWRLCTGTPIHSEASD